MAFAKMIDPIPIDKKSVEIFLKERELMNARSDKGVKQLKNDEK